MASQRNFYNRFASPQEMAEFIGAADIYITPYRHEAQVVSGTLAYALGGARRSFQLPIGTPLSCWTTAVAHSCPSKIPTLSRTRLSNSWIRRDPHAMRKRAYLFARDMVWQRVAQGYMESFARVRSDRLETPRVQFSARAIPKELDQLPELKLSHLQELTDDTGMLQHAIFTIPNRGEGHTTDDNARALASLLCWSNRAKTESEKKDHWLRVSPVAICHSSNTRLIRRTVASEIFSATIAGGTKPQALKTVMGGHCGRWVRFSAGRKAGD